MHDSTKQTIEALDGWSKALKTYLPDRNQPMNRVWNWTAPSVTRADIELRISRIKTKLENLPDELEGLVEIEVGESHERLTWITNNVIPHITNGNSVNVVSQIYQEFDRLDKALGTEHTDWEKISSSELVPKRLTTRLRALEHRLSNLEPRSGGLEEKIKLIEDATASAEQLPTDLATLAEGRNEVAAVQRMIEASAAKVENASAAANASLTQVTEIAGNAEKLFERLEEVYKAGSTRGLAAAFSDKASSLNQSLYAWTALLIIALVAGGWIGSNRFDTLQSILAKPTTGTAFWANFILSIMSLAAPIWFGWVATKQISQRFKLAEDYSFKASVATAYEGYRSEAVRLDPEFERRLFGSALTRLEEAPLRFVETEDFGTPWHELTSSPAFAKALDVIPDLKGTVAKIVAAGSGAGVGLASMPLMTNRGDKRALSLDSEGNQIDREASETSD